jgi:hypothetical protein
MFCTDLNIVFLGNCVVSETFKQSRTNAVLLRGAKQHHLD